VQLEGGGRGRGLKEQLLQVFIAKGINIDYIALSFLYKSI